MVMEGDLQEVVNPKINDELTPDRVAYLKTSDPENLSLGELASQFDIDTFNHIDKMQPKDRSPFDKDEYERMSALWGVFADRLDFRKGSGGLMEKYFGTFQDKKDEEMADKLDRFGKWQNARAELVELSVRHFQGENVEQDFRGWVDLNTPKLDVGHEVDADRFWKDLKTDKPFNKDSVVTEDWRRGKTGTEFDWANMDYETEGWLYDLLRKMDKIAEASGKPGTAKTEEHADVVIPASKKREKRTARSGEISKDAFDQFLHAEKNLEDALENLKFARDKFKGSAFGEISNFKRDLKLSDTYQQYRESFDSGESVKANGQYSERETLQRRDDSFALAWKEFKTNSGVIRERTKSEVVGKRFDGEKQVDVTLGDLEEEINKLYPDDKSPGEFLTDLKFKELVSKKVELIAKYNEGLRNYLERGSKKRKEAEPEKEPVLSDTAVEAKPENPEEKTPVYWFLRTPPEDKIIYNAKVKKGDETEDQWLFIRMRKIEDKRAKPDSDNIKYRIYSFMFDGLSVTELGAITRSDDEEALEIIRKMLSGMVEEDGPWKTYHVTELTPDLEKKLREAKEIKYAPRKPKEPRKTRRR